MNHFAVRVPNCKSPIKKKGLSCYKLSVSQIVNSVYLLFLNLHVFSWPILST